MPRGNTAALLAYRKRITPEQQMEINKKISEAAKRRRETTFHINKVNTLAISVRTMENGKYVPGSSRTINFVNFKANPDQFIELLQRKAHDLHREAQGNGNSHRVPKVVFNP